MKNQLKKLSLIILAICQSQMSFAQTPAPASKPSVVTPAPMVTVGKDEKYLILTGEGSGAEDRNPIIVKVNKDIFYSFKYCSIQANSPNNKNIEDVRLAYNLDATAESNGILAATLFASPSCQVITHNPVYVMHLLTEDELSTQVDRGLENADWTKHKYSVARYALGGLGAGGALLSFIQFSQSRPKHNSLSLFSFIFSKNNSGRTALATSIVLAAAAAGSQYLHLKASKEYRSIDLMSNFVNRNGRLLQVDGTISEMKSVLEQGLVDAVRHGDISAM